jgi:hypothetical protein
MNEWEHQYMFARSFERRTMMVLEGSIRRLEDNPLTSLTVRVAVLA